MTNNQHIQSASLMCLLDVYFDWVVESIFANEYDFRELWTVDEAHLRQQNEDTP